MAQTLSSNDHIILRTLDSARDIYASRNQRIRESYEMYYQFDKLQSEGAKTISTSDVRAAADMAIHLLSRHGHRERLPKSLQDVSQQTMRDKAERAIKGWWRNVDFGPHGYLRQGRSWHQRELGAWQVITGWAIQYTALIPGADGSPIPIANLLDVSSVYPFWDGPYQELSHLGYVYRTSGRRLKTMALVGAFPIDENIPDDAEVSILDYWEERYNPQDRKQPDVLNTVFYSIGTHSSLPGASGSWVLLRESFNLSPNSVGKINGFPCLPFIVLRADNVPIASAYEQGQAGLHSLTTGGLIGPMKKEWEALNEVISTFWQDLKEALKDTMTLAIHSPGGQDTFTDSERGRIKQLDSDTGLSHPIARNPIMSPVNVMVDYLRSRLSHLSFTSEVFGDMTRALSGVSLKTAQEAARTPVEPYKTGGEFLYGETGRLWLDEYARRWANSSRGRIRVQGQDPRLGFYDEDFSPEDMPDSTFMISEIDLALPADEMMQANIFRALNPNAKMSLSYLRENVMNVPDMKLEAEQLAADNVEQSPVMINTEVARKMFEIAEAAETDGDARKATIFALAGQELMMSLLPQQGRGVPERPGQGPPEAGGVRSNQGGTEPALSPANMPTEPGEIAAPAGGGPMGQIERNI